MEAVLDTSKVEETEIPPLKVLRAVQELVNDLDGTPEVPQSNLIYEEEH